jgi:serine/threonine protein kinase
MTKMAIGPGDTVDGRYELRREITRSRRSLLFEAQHVISKRAVALKLLKPGIARDPLEYTALLVQARMLAECVHPSIVHLLDAGTIDVSVPDTVNVPFVVMEMLDGRNLEGVLGGRGKVSVGAAVRIGLSLCRALARIHRAGFVHGGVTPEHIMLAPRTSENQHWESEERIARLINLGRAARAEAGVRIPPGLRNEGIEYQSPEQLNGEELSPASDVYSLGVVLYECLTGNPPIGRIIVSPHKLNADVPKPVSVAIEAAVSRDPAERPQDAKAFADALSKTTPAPPPRKPPQPKKKRRAAQRVAYMAPVQIRRDVGAPIEAHCEDISVGGMMVVSGAQLKADEHVVVHFAVPTSGEEVIAPAIVRWRKSARGSVFIGLQIERLSDKARKAIEQHVGRLNGPERAS